MPVPEYCNFPTVGKVVVHELLHVVGVKHEQCRPDRDDYITIDWSNIQSGGPSQYYKVIYTLLS